MNRPSGLDEKNLFTIASLGFAPGFDRSASIQEDLATMRAMPGVVGATAINNLPLSGGGWGQGVSTKPLTKVWPGVVAVAGQYSAWRRLTRPLAHARRGS